MIAIIPENYGMNKKQYSCTASGSNSVR